MNTSSRQNSNNQAAISGTVMGPQGHPIARATVMFTGDSPPHADIAALSDAQGHYRFADLIPGTYMVLVNAEGYAAQTQQVQTVPGQDVHLDFHLSE